MSHNKITSAEKESKKFAIYDDIRVALAAKHNDDLTKYYHHRITFLIPNKKGTITISGAKVNIINLSCNCDEYSELKGRGFDYDCIESFCIHISKAVLYKTKPDRLSKLLLESRIKGNKEKLIKMTINDEVCYVAKPILETTKWINIYVSFEKGTKWIYYSYNLEKKEWSHSIKPQNSVEIEEFLHKI